MDHEKQATPSPAEKQGYLIIRVATARGAIPLEGAEVTVFTYSPDTDVPRGGLIAARITDRSGSTSPIALPAPPRQSSLSPQNGKTPPYYGYTVDVRLDGYTAQQYINVPIFEGITAIQEADLIPLPENERPDGRTPDGERFFESSAPDL